MDYDESDNYFPSEDYPTDYYWDWCDMRYEYEDGSPVPDLEPGNFALPPDSVGTDALAPDGADGAPGSDVDYEIAMPLCPDDDDDPGGDDGTAMPPGTDDGDDDDDDDDDDDECIEDPEKLPECGMDCLEGQCVRKGYVYSCHGRSIV
ncbi:MAG: hypothetical protein AAGM21_16965, partial [Pseudomonadota bacterium]